MAAALIRDFPEYYPWHAVREYEYGGIKQRNRNRLLFSDDSVDGLKTGYTKAARYCLVASAERDGMRLIAVVMGAESSRARTRMVRSLLNYGFRFYGDPAGVRIRRGGDGRAGVEGRCRAALARTRAESARDGAARPLRRDRRGDGDRIEAHGPGERGRAARRPATCPRRRAGGRAASGRARTTWRKAICGGS